MHVSPDYIVTVIKTCNKVTIAMSALFDSGNGVLISLSEIPQTLELRSIPSIRKVSISRDEFKWRFNYSVSDITSRLSFGDMVKDNLYTPDTNWMYTAII
jgi:hypothetical protein